MKKTLLILLFTFPLINLFGQNTSQTTEVTDKSFPTNFSEESFKEIKKFKGEIVAFDGIIEKIENSRNNTPFYKLRIGDDKFLWTVLMFKNEANQINDTIKVVGYLSKIKQLNESEKKFLEGKYMVIAFGLIDFKNSNFLFVNGIDKQKQEWINGKIPSSN